jgi:hypothetical protein
MKGRGGRGYLGFGEGDGGCEEDGWRGRNVAAISGGQACGRIERVRFLSATQARPRRRFPPGVQNLSMKGSRNGMVATVVEERGKKGQERMEQGVYQSTPQVLFSDVYIEIYSTRDARLSLPLRIPAIPRPTRSPRRIDCPVVRTPNLSVCAE